MGSCWLGGFADVRSWWGNARPAAIYELCRMQITVQKACRMGTKVEEWTSRCQVFRPRPPEECVDKPWASAILAGLLATATCEKGSCERQVWEARKGILRS